MSHFFKQRLLMDEPHFPRPNAGKGKLRRIWTCLRPLESHPATRQWTISHQGQGTVTNEPHFVPRSRPQHLFGLPVG
jgi:hypothetical protein